MILKYQCGIYKVEENNLLVDKMVKLHFSGCCEFVYNAVFFKLMFQVSKN